MKLMNLAEALTTTPPTKAQRKDLLVQRALEFCDAIREERNARTGAVLPDGHFRGIDGDLRCELDVVKATTKVAEKRLALWHAAEAYRYAPAKDLKSPMEELWDHFAKEDGEGTKKED